ncbi:hypothetical protein PITCH_A1390002 [uncultured Desulfobacterium sp.]|uniref:HEAT repeat domain-containing protein n=1 Tax=uncultured Desulfobacterium sp. TaxID=201089 RepID=A0A445MSL6_9BACT|nr:hypothetical protein PITCH_A1390002 [uncultured Desulfobacterium sp.]
MTTTYWGHPHKCAMPLNDITATDNFKTNCSANKNLTKSTVIIKQTDEDKKPEWIEDALKAMENPDIGLRIQGVIALRDHPCSEAIDLLEMFLADADYAVIEEALDAIGFIGLNSELKEKALTVLAEAARDRDFLSRGAALITAAALGENDTILTIIGEYISENNDQSLESAVKAMALIASPACVPYLAEVISGDLDPEVLKNSFNILAQIGSQEAIDILQRSFNSPDSQMQTSVAWAISRVKNEVYSRMLAESMEGLNHETLSVIANSALASEVFGEALQSENATKENKNYWLDILAANTVTAPGSVRSEVADLLIALSNDPDPEIQVKSLNALAQVGASINNENLSEHLSSKLESDNFLVQGAALLAFAQYCTPANYKVLKTLWSHQDEQMRRTAFFLSENFLNASDLPDLQKASQSNDQFIAKHSKIVMKYLTLGNS